MKKKILILFFTIGLNNFAIAQKEFWGTMYGSPGYNYHGYIFKTDANGENPLKMHTFDSINGKQSRAPLFLASNGKLYGTTTAGGFNFNPDFSGGVLYEYDLTLDKFRAVSFFGDATIPNMRYPLYSGVIEPTIGTLIGTIRAKGTFKYNMVTEETSEGATVPNFVSNGQIFPNELSGELVKASDGFVYGTTIHSSSNPNGSPFVGIVVKINPTTNALTYAHPLSAFTQEEGANPPGSLIEGLPNKLYGTTYFGGVYIPDIQTIGGGVLFEYDFVTNTFVKKLDFYNSTTGSFPLPLIKGNDGKMYGVTGSGGGINPENGLSYRGTLYEYYPTTNTINILYRFTTEPSNLIMASDGNLYWVNILGVNKFDLTTNTLTQSCFFDFDTFPGYGFTSRLIEICRKPSYHFLDIDTFDACVGSTFTYDIQNTNATSYQWLKNNINIVGQTTGILNLTNLTTSDAGNYTCTMTNECGTTTTMVLQLTVNCLGTNTVANLEKGITIYPNPAKNILNLKLPENIDVNVNSITIANSLGQIVLIQKTENTTTIDVSNLQKGIYIISLSTNYGNWNGKFVKE